MDRGYRKVSGVSCSRSLFERLLLSMRGEKKNPPVHKETKSGRYVIRTYHITS